MRSQSERIKKSKESKRAQTRVKKESEDKRRESSEFTPMSRSVTLRIKKVFFDEIKSGEKKVEYRSVKDFYERLFEGRPISKLILHYQKSARLVVEVKDIDIIRRPKFLDSESFTPRVFAIQLGRVISSRP